VPAPGLLLGLFIDQIRCGVPGKTLGARTCTLEVHDDRPQGRRVGLHGLGARHVYDDGGRLGRVLVSLIHLAGEALHLVDQLVDDSRLCRSRLFQGIGNQGFSLG
jgi:hypothetical protein